MIQFLFSMMKSLILAVFLLCSYFALAQVPQRPSPQRLYNNLSVEFPNFLSESESDMLEQKLVNFSRETSNQICIVVTDDLNGLDAASYATEIGNTWGVGKKEFDNGIVILIKPTGSAGGRDLFIAVGYGLEGAIPDLATMRVREDEMYPYLKNGENYAALNNATDKLMALAKGEISVKDYTSQSKNDTLKHLLIIAVIIFVIWAISKNKGGGGGGYTYSSGRGFGGGGFSGGSSSSFGGFGGGSFGGGGSGGKW